MPTKTRRRPTRPTAKITPALLAAKAEAVSRFLGPGPELRVTPPLAASTRPEHNVVGVGIGPKVKGGRATTRRSIRFYVVRKVPSGSVPTEFALPREIRGVPTDVIETGRFVALGVPIAQRRLRPAKGGCSVGFQFSGSMAGYVMAGTFGALVEDPGGARFILSNNHVLANENALPIGSPIFQPGLLDHGNPASDEIARLTRFVRIQPLPATNSVDAAIARLDAPDLAVPTILPQVGRLASPAPVPAAEGMKVHKHGRTTGYRRGHIVDVSADVTVGYDFGNARFIDQMLIVGDAGKAFSGAGDSGSLIVDRGTRRATGLLFAGSSSHTIANHIEPVLGALGVSLL
jgi:hypothetical protein